MRRQGLMGEVRRPHDSSGERAGLTAQLADAVVRRILDTSLAEVLIAQIIQVLTRSDELDQLVTKLVSDLEASPAVASLVDRQVQRALETLAESDALQALIRKQADAYLEHLGRHPEAVQRLIQEQSRGVLDDFLRALREHASTADDAVSRWARRALGRA